MNYLEFKFSFDPQKVNGEILLAELTEIPFESFVEEEGEVIGYIIKDKYHEGVLDSIVYLADNDISISSKEIQQVNWNEEWEKNFNPIEISDECVIRADFHQLEKSYKYDIRINPKMSFGTGHHETTSLMLAEMLNLNFIDSDVLDMGTGTGVLAVLAAMMGSKKILAIDNDEWAYKNAIENVALNNYSKEIEVLEGGVELIGTRSFNVVLANINKNILKAQIATYTSSLQPNGKLLLSGILIEDCDEIIDLAHKNGLKKIGKSQKNKWAMLAFSN